MLMYDSYKFSFDRINLAINQEFYIEAIAIEESIISDRLFSLFANIKGTISEEDKKMSLHNLIGTVKKKLKKYNEYIEILDSIDNWRMKRNLIVHKIAKADKGIPAILAQDFLPLAKEIAKEGKELAHQASNLKRIVTSKLKKEKNAKTEV